MTESGMLSSGLGLGLEAPRGLISLVLVLVLVSEPLVLVLVLVSGPVVLVLVLVSGPLVLDSPNFLFFAVADLFLNKQKPSNVNL